MSWPAYHHVSCGQLPPAGSIGNIYASHHAVQTQPLTPSLKARGDNGRVGPDTGWLRSRGTKMLLPEVAFVNLGYTEVWVQLEEYD